MLSIFSRLPRPGFSLSLRAALLVAAAGTFGACDRHSAAEVPENYGHGSSHERVSPDHQTDSNGQQHFSDTSGMQDEPAGEPHGTPSASPTASPAGKIF